MKIVQEQLTQIFRELLGILTTFKGPSSPIIRRWNGPIRLEMVSCTKTQKNLRLKFFHVLNRKHAIHRWNDPISSERVSCPKTQKNLRLKFFHVVS